MKAGTCIAGSWRASSGGGGDGTKGRFSAGFRSTGCPLVYEQGMVDGEAVCNAHDACEAACVLAFPGV